MINYRKDLRIKTDLPCTGYFEGTKINIKICNISRSGACLQMNNHHIIKDNTVQINFVIPFIEKEICLIAENKWQKSYEHRLKMGVEFINVTLLEKIEISYYIDSMIFSTTNFEDNSELKTV